MLELLAWIVIGVVLLGLGFTQMLAASYSWRLWPVIRRARRKVREVARRRNPNVDVSSSQGATAISPRYLAFCIRTDTDKERDLLCEDPEIYQQFRDALLRAGYPQDAIPFVHFGIQSQETVDRDYGGRWHEAGQMP